MPAGPPYGNRNAEIEFTEELNRKEFKSEKEYTIYIEDNIELFCDETLDLGNLVDYEKQKSLEKASFKRTTQRVDFYIIGTKGSALVELKNPIHYFSEMRNAIAQLLYYGALAKSYDIKHDKLCMVSPVFDRRLFLMIKEYNLPVELYLVTKLYNGKILIL